MFAGLISFNANFTPELLVSEESLRKSLSPYREVDCHGYWQGENACLFEMRTYNSRSNRDETLPLSCPETGIKLAFWGRLDNRRDLARQLEIDNATLEKLTDSHLVMAGWQKWQESLPERLLGDFALAIIDPQRQCAFLARDPLGVKPLYYRLDGNLFAFATTVAALKTLKHLPLTPDQEWMACYLWFLSKSNEKTAYHEINKMLPGHLLTVDSSGNHRLRRWHNWRDDAPSATKRDERWVKEYRQVLEEAIRCRMESDYPLGTENSGGIDSATITAFLAHFMGTPGNRLHSFGFALCEQEPSFILETSQAKRIIHNYLITAHHSESLNSMIERGLTVMGYPEEHGNATHHIPFYSECEMRNIRTLFSGFGGDEVVTNPGHLLRFELLDQSRYPQLLDILPGNWLTRPLRLAKAMTLGYKNPPYRPTFYKAWSERWSHLLLRDEVVERFNIHQRYMETARYDAPYRSVNDFILQHLLQQPFISARLENCTLMAASYGIDYRWPLWDVRLVQQYLSTPAIEKVGPKGIGRYLHRQAIDDVVPKRVAWKPSKDMGYKQLHQQVNQSGIISTAKRAEELELELHPALEELIDRNMFRGQIERAAKGNVDDGFSFAFGNSYRSMQWLNQWLRGG